MTPEFTPFPKIARLFREIIITEKIDGTNSTVYIDDDGNVFAGSRNRWITPQNDNYGFAAWVEDHVSDLRGLGQGFHRGEWWGKGIQRGYGLSERRFSLFNTARWCLHGETPKTIATADPRIIKTQDILPSCCHLVPVIYRGEFCTVEANLAIEELETYGSLAAPGYMKPEGIITFHVAANMGFKTTIEKDEMPKGY